MLFVVCRVLMSLVVVRCFCCYRLQLCVGCRCWRCLLFAVCCLVLLLLVGVMCCCCSVLRLCCLLCLVWRWMLPVICVWCLLLCCGVLSVVLLLSGADCSLKLLVGAWCCVLCANRYVVSCSLFNGCCCGCLVIDGVVNCGCVLFVRRRCYWFVVAACCAVLFMGDVRWCLSLHVVGNVVLCFDCWRRLLLLFDVGGVLLLFGFVCRCSVLLLAVKPCYC